VTTLNYHEPYEHHGWDNTLVGFDNWVDEYFRHLNEQHMNRMANLLDYHGCPDNELEFGVGDVRTDFNPYLNNTWTAYDLSAPVSDMARPYKQCRHR
jgi:hypothetical protein